MKTATTSSHGTVEPTRLACHRLRNGLSIVYVIPLLLALFAMISLAVDMGRVRTSKAQLSTAADAAALAAAPVLPAADLAPAQTRALEVAAANHCEGAPVTLVADEDIEFGVYRAISGRYTALGATEPSGNVISANECNAVKVTPKRIAARGSAIPLSFARLIGVSTKDVEATATAFVRGGRRGGGIVGIDWVEMNGITRTDSYSGEPYDPDNANSNGTVMSNGTISMVGTCDIYGDARPGVESFVDHTANATVHGWEAPLDEPLVYPPATVPAGVTNSGTLRINGSQTYTLAAGTYWFSSLTINGGGTLIIEPQVKIYVTGDIDMTGGSVTNSGTPSDFEINKVGPGSVDLGGSSTLKAHVYAPEADVTIHGTSSEFGLFGWVIGKTLDIMGNSAIHYDETLEHLNLPRRAVLVR